MEGRLDQPFLLSYQVGVNLAVNAIPDAWLVVDGPNCVLFRTTQIQGNHDWNADLMRSSGLHRVADTDCTPDRAAVGDARILEDRLGRIDRLDECELILLSAMAPVAVTGRQYDGIVQRMDPPLQTPVIHLPSGSLTSDWLSGYAQTLDALARQLPLDGPAGAADEVGIVGYLMDRNEADHGANLRELARLVEAAGGRYAGCWLAGGGLRQLQRAGRAGTLVSLPYGREAARTLADRTGARLIECHLPVGLEGTSRFVGQLAAALGHSDPAQAWLAAEQAGAARKLEWILPKRLFGKRLVIIADPHLGAALGQAMIELGCRVPLRIYWSTQAHVEASERPREGHLLTNPQPEDVLAALRILCGDGCSAPDLVLTNSQALSILRRPPGLDLPWLEIGFPSFHHHALFDAPWLGLSGTLCLVDRVANALAQAQVLPASAGLDTR